MLVVKINAQNIHFFSVYPSLVEKMSKKITKLNIKKQKFTDYIID